MNASENDFASLHCLLRNSVYLGLSVTVTSTAKTRMKDGMEECISYNLHNISITQQSQLYSTDNWSKISDLSEHSITNPIF